MIFNQCSIKQHPGYETHKQMQRKRVQVEVRAIIAEADALRRKLEGKRILECANKS